MEYITPLPKEIEALLTEISNKCERYYVKNKQTNNQEEKNIVILIPQYSYKWTTKVKNIIVYKYITIQKALSLFEIFILRMRIVEYNEKKLTFKKGKQIIIRSYPHKDSLVVFDDSDTTSMKFLRLYGVLINPSEEKPLELFQKNTDHIFDWNMSTFFASRYLHSKK
jgi:hypothetical protein